MDTDIRQKPLMKDQVLGKVLEMISMLDLKPGDRLASEKSVAEKFRVNHLTLRAAYAELADRGILERRRGSGTYIRHLPGKDVGNGSFSFAGNRTVVIVMRDDPHFFSGLRNDIINELQHRGFIPVILGSGSRTVEADIEKLKSYQDMGIANLIIDQTESDNLNRAFLSGPECRYGNIVRILGNHSTAGVLPGCMISGDYATAYQNAIAHFKSKGHSDIAFFCGTVSADNPARTANKKFISLYTQAMIENDLAEYIDVITASYEDSCMEKSIKDILTNPERPTALFCDIDYRAVKVIDTARAMGIKVPEELSVMGFFDTPWAKHYDLSTFRFRNHEIAVHVADALEFPGSKAETTLCPIDMVERSSVAAVPKHQPTSTQEL